MIYAVALAATIAATPTGVSHGRYYGPPNLALTAQMLNAGGGVPKFSSHTLFLYLAGPHADDEARSLVKRFGASNVGQFFTTFDEFVQLAAVQSRNSTSRSRRPPPSPGRFLRSNCTKPASCRTAALTLDICLSTSYRGPSM
jgi:hypothetical protein